MAPSLGKRKRSTAATPSAVAEERSTDTIDDDAQDIFRKLFEQKFLPIEDHKTRKRSKTKAIEKLPESMSDEDDEMEDEEVEDVLEVAEDDIDSDSDWEGISESEDDSPKIEVVEHKDYSAAGNMSRAELKAFMSSKLPKSLSTKMSLNATPDDDDDDTSEAANLKNDLALQRLLAESHLLDSAHDTTPTGKNRHKALDLRVMALGAKTSILAQDKMPMAHRKGMRAKQAAREDTRRREARENGIILERPQPARQKSSAARRERTVGAPSVGKFRSATLRLSQKDIRDIEGPRRGSRRGRGRR